MIVDQAPPVYGGAGTQALRLASELTRSGLNVEILTQNRARAPSTEVLDGVKVRRYWTPRSASRFRTFVFLPQIMVALFARRPDVIHVHGAFWYTLPAVLTGKLLGIPVLV